MIHVVVLGKVIAMSLDGLPPHVGINLVLHASKSGQVI